MNRIVVPPGGFAGFSQMTPASQAALRGSGSRGMTRRRKRKSSKRSSKRSTRAKRTGSRKMKFGSPAWQKKYKVGKFRKK